MMTKNQVKIGDRIIGDNQPCFIIAEAGVNHNGDINLAKKLIDAASKAGVDAIKFQVFKTNDLIGVDTKVLPYQKKAIPGVKSQRDMLKRLELSYADFIKLKKYCDKKKIIFLATAHTTESVDFLGNIVLAYKVGSGDLTNLPFLRNIALKKKPIILSTGMSTLSEVDEALRVIIKGGNRKIVLLHCTTSYPCPVEDIHLRAMQTLARKFKLPVGYSDHSIGFLAPVIAVSLGAYVIEKHFTLDKNMPGPDHKASLEPGELKEMVRLIRGTEKALGQNVKKPTLSEKKIMALVRKSLTAAIDIPRGVIIREYMLSIRRPGNGISPKDIDRVVGKRARVSIKKNELLLWSRIR